jgi:Kef-type K+ transport system membrane component KefB/nucleotide-binding universal stress UspA family protein
MAFQWMRSGTEPSKPLVSTIKPILYVAAVFALTASLAHAAESRGAHAPSEFILLIQIALLVLVGRGLGEIMQRIGQPSVIGELLGGLILGPSLFGWVWPAGHSAIFPPSPEQKAMIGGIAQYGILLLLLLTGMETDLKLVRKVGKAAIVVSIAGIVVPFACGFTLGEFLPDRLLPHPEARFVASLFLGTALSISSVKIVAVVVREMNFMRRDVGQIIVATAVIDDTLGWIMIAVIFSLASSGTLDIPSISKAILGTLLFLAISFTIGRRLTFQIIRWANDYIASSGAVITVILLLMSVMAAITHLIGVHTVLGAFVAGILVGQSPILTRQIDERLRGLITSLFMPVFFGLAGLSADLTVLKNPDLLLLTGGLILIASLGKFGGAFIGGTIGGLSGRESLALASGMNARGSTEVIIATIGLSMGVLSNDMFSMIVTMAIVTTMAMPPMLRAALARLPLGANEKARLEREETEEKGFVANLERMLLAVDGSANAKFASTIAGLLAGARGVPISVLNLGATPEKEVSKDQTHEAAVKKAAKAASDADPEAEARKVDVTIHESQKDVGEAVANEARKGFDFLLIGLESTVGPDGEFDSAVGEVAAAFEGPLAVVDAKGEHLNRPQGGSFQVLVPVSGSAVSHRGAEVAIALARTGSLPLHAIYVSTTRDKGSRRSSTGASVFQEEAILKEIVSLAARYGVDVVTSIQANAAPEEAILREIRKSGSNLVVMGADRIQGDALNFGGVASAILQKSDVSIVLVSGGESNGRANGTRKQER